MIFPLLVAVETSEIRHKVIAAAFAFIRSIRRVIFMGMRASTASSPLINIKPFPPRQPPLTHFLRPPGNKPEVLAGAVLAASLRGFLRERLLVVFEEVAAEATGL